MLPKPLAEIAPNTLEFEVLPLVKPTGFREYDARWWFNGIGHDKAPELNLTGVQALGLGGQSAAERAHQQALHAAGGKPGHQVGRLQHTAVEVHPRLDMKNLHGFSGSPVNRFMLPPAALAEVSVAD